MKSKLPDKALLTKTDYGAKSPKKKQKHDHGCSDNSDSADHYLEEKPYKFFINDNKRGSLSNKVYRCETNISCPSLDQVSVHYDLKYVVNIPVVASDNKKSVSLQKIIETESFGKTAKESLEQTKNRVSVVVGINKKKSVIEANNKILDGELTTPIESSYPYKRFGYFWKPEWIKIEPDGYTLTIQVTDQNVSELPKKMLKLPTLLKEKESGKLYLYCKWLDEKPSIKPCYGAVFNKLFSENYLSSSIIVSYTENKDLFNLFIEKKYHSGKTKQVKLGTVKNWCTNSEMSQEDKERHVAIEEAKPTLKMIPYREIRNNLNNSKECLDLLNHAQNTSKKTYLMFFDSSIESLLSLADGVGVMSCYDNMILKYNKKNQGHYPEIISTGYRIDPVKYPLDSKGVRYDMDIRTQSNKYNPNSIYPPEPNFGILTLAGQNPENFIDGNKQYSSPNESLILIKNILENRKIEINQLGSIFKGKHAVQIEARPRMLLKSKNGERKEFQSSKVNFRGEYINWSQQDFKNFRNTSQSHFKPKEWAKYTVDKHEIKAIEIYQDSKDRLFTSLNLIRLSCDPEKYQYWKLKKLLGERSTYILFKESLYYFDNQHPLVKLTVNVDELSKLFPANEDQLTTIKGANLDRILSITGVIYHKHALTIAQVKMMAISLLSKLFTAYDPISIANKMIKQNNINFDKTFVNVINNYYEMSPYIVNASRKKCSHDLYKNYFDKTKSVDEIKKYLCLLSDSLGNDFKMIEKAAIYSGSQIYENIFYEFLTGYPQVVSDLFTKFTEEFFYPPPEPGTLSDHNQTAMIKDICEDNFAIIANRSFERRGFYQMTYLHLAALAGNTKYVRFILGQKLLNRNVEAAHGILPLHCAIEYYIQHDEDYDFEQNYENDLNLIDLLVDNYNLFSPMPNKKTALYRILTKLREPDILIDHLYKKNRIGISLYQPLALYTNMLKRCIPFEAFNNPFIHIIEQIEDGHQAAILIELFAKMGADININFRKNDCDEEGSADLPVFLAIRRGDLSILKAIDYVGGNFCDIYDYRGLPPLLAAIFDGASLNMLKTLYDCGASLTNNNLERDILYPALRTCAFFEIIRLDDSRKYLDFLKYIVDNSEPEEISNLIITCSCELDYSEADDDEDLELLDLIINEELIEVIDLLFFNKDDTKSEILKRFSDEIQEKIVKLRFGSQSLSSDYSETEEDSQSTSTEKEKPYNPEFFKAKTESDSVSRSANNRFTFG